MHHTICDNLPSRKFCLMSYTFLTSPTLVDVNLMQMWTAPYLVSSTWSGMLKCMQIVWKGARRPVLVQVPN